MSALVNLSEHCCGNVHNRFGSTGVESSATPIRTDWQRLGELDRSHCRIYGRSDEHTYELH